MVSLLIYQKKTISVENTIIASCFIIKNFVYALYKMIVFYFCLYKMLFFDYEMCTLQKGDGEDSKGRRVLWMPETSLKQLI